MSNPTDTNQASEVKRNSLNKSDIDVKLDEILDTLAEKSADSDSRLGYVDAYEFAQEAKQAIIDWHNKQIGAVLIGFAKEADTEYSRSEIDKWLFSLGAIVHEAVIEAERNKLKESSDD